MIAGTTFDVLRSAATSACWMVAGRWVLVGSKMAPLPWNIAHDKGRSHAHHAMREISSQ